jgi:predicted nucleic-acid-binding Zn-ribbon protein
MKVICPKCKKPAVVKHDFSTTPGNMAKLFSSYLECSHCGYTTKGVKKS